MDLLAEALLKHETLNADDMKAIIEGKPELVKTKIDTRSATSSKETPKTPVEGPNLPIPAKGSGEIFNVT